MSGLTTSDGTSQNKANARTDTTVRGDIPNDAVGGDIPNDGATVRDRQFAREARLVMLVWGFIWSAILAFLFVFGDVLTAIFL